MKGKLRNPLGQMEAFLAPDCFASTRASINRLAALPHRQSACRSCRCQTSSFCREHFLASLSLRLKLSIGVKEDGEFKAHFGFYESSPVDEAGIVPSTFLVCSSCKRSPPVRASTIMLSLDPMRGSIPGREMRVCEGRRGVSFCIISRQKVACLEGTVPFPAPERNRVPYWSLEEPQMALPGFQGVLLGVVLCFFS